MILEEKLRNWLQEKYALYVDELKYVDEWKLLEELSDMLKDETK